MSLFTVTNYALKIFLSMRYVNLHFTVVCICNAPCVKTEVLIIGADGNS